MKNQGENKNRNKFDSHMFMHFIADLTEIGPFYFLCILMSNIYIYIYINDVVLKTSLLSKHLMGIPNLALIHGTLYRAWQCDPLVGSRCKVPKAPTILRYLKPENS